MKRMYVEIDEWTHFLWLLLKKMIYKITIKRMIILKMIDFTISLGIKKGRTFMMKDRTVQISESMRLGILLSLSGGFMDAYSYIERGKVFANAQTGNILLLGISLSEGEYVQMIHYLLPIMAFVCGIALSDVIRIKKQTFIHWRQISIIMEAVILFVVAFIPHHYNLLANSLTSLACGIQVESFRKIHGITIATTMCIGNLRGGTQNLCQYFVSKEKGYLKNGLLYFGIITSFVVGAVIGHIFIQSIHQYAIVFCSCLLFVSFMLMFQSA